ncbi:DUF2087 domain-containing protein [Candidatus Bipolaricaulota bacterium]|jgi:hypothetical protein|nr:DUF2087 domain-containing protein [Candidatus Bipolaricaulota bacterium]
MDVQWTDWERRVLNIFMEGEKIRQLPAKQKKRKVILKWLAAQIPPEIRISHAEFNRLIQRHHPDSATLRREMFEFGYVHRDRDHYWRDVTPLEPRV